PALREAGEHGVWSRTAPSWESPYVSQGFLDIQRELVSHRAFEVEYEAKFVDWAGMVFDSESIEGCIVPRVEIQGGPISIGVDWGRYEDFTAVAVLEGDRTQSRLLELVQFRRNKWPEMVSRVAQIIRRYPHAEVLGDGTGVGDVVADMLDMEMGKPVKVLKFTNESKQHLIEGLKICMESQRMQFAPDPELIRQLKHFESSVSSAGNTLLAARSGTHDDLVIALALGCSLLPKGPAGPVLLGETRVFAKPRLKFEDLCFSAN
ncbi:MAG: hypothetical protein H7Y17_08685, partial [Chlorobia bacterium]|nr:hypothetical protein [Fimbriimonadaceae bacterium]